MLKTRPARRRLAGGFNAAWPYLFCGALLAGSALAMT
jgi:hypothetical protein